MCAERGRRGGPVIFSYVQWIFIIFLSGLTARLPRQVIFHFGVLCHQCASGAVLEHPACSINRSIIHDEATWLRAVPRLRDALSVF